ncbi:hypothetical protein BGZ52_003102, partial [Haplosporangium bisporale]
STIHTGAFSQQLDAYLTSLRQDYQRQLQDYESLNAIAKEDPYFSATVVAELDAQDEDPFTLDSFENLMRLHAAKGKDFILARVMTQDPNDETKHYHSYYSAHQINKVLFRTQPDEGLLHRMKARNPLNNMLVVGDVHYYIITAEAINAIKPLPTVRSSSSSILSHSSRMSRCSKLAAQAIATQPASARSSPILGSDCSLFSRGTSPTPFDAELPVSIIPPIMAQSVMLADYEEQLRQRHKTNSPMMSPVSSPCSLVNINERTSVPGISSRRSSVSSNHSAPGFQPGRPSRLRQAIRPEEIQEPSPFPGDQPQGLTSALEHQEQRFISSSPPSSSSMPHLPTHSSPSQSPLFQNLMVTSGQKQSRSRCNTVSSISSDESGNSTTSHISHASQCSSALADYPGGSPLLASSSPSTSFAPSTPTMPHSSSPSPSNSSSPSTPTMSHSSSSSEAFYQFKYMASDDDFLLRSTVRQLFKANALESWDAILFTISNNALHENQQGITPHDMNNPLPPLPSPSLQQPPEGGGNDEGANAVNSPRTPRRARTPRELPETSMDTMATERPASELSHSGDSAIGLSDHEGSGVNVSEPTLSTSSSSSSSFAGSVGSTSHAPVPSVPSNGNHGGKKFRRALSKIFSIHS